MGCCIRNQEKIVIEPSNIDYSDQESFDNESENENEFPKNSNTKIIIPKQKKTSDKSTDFVIQKEKNKAEKKNLKTMNILKEITYNEVRDCIKYF